MQKFVIFARVHPTKPDKTIYHYGKEKRKERKEGRQTHDQERACQGRARLLPPEAGRSTTAEIHLRTAAPDHPSAENALYGRPSRVAGRRLHQRNRKEQIQAQYPRRGDDGYLPAQEQRQELLHPRRRRRPHLHRRTQLGPCHGRRPREDSLLCQTTRTQRRRRSYRNTGAGQRHLRGHARSGQVVCLPRHREPHAGQ